MRFLSYIEFDLSLPFGPPPEALRHAVTGFAAEASAQGVLVDHGGLASPDDSSHVLVEDARLTVTDGPFAEAKEAIGGYLMYDARSKDEAAEYARRFMQLHVELWPGFKGVCVTRRVLSPEGPDGC